MLSLQPHVSVNYLVSQQREFGMLVTILLEKFGFILTVDEIIDTEVRNSEIIESRASVKDSC